MGEEAGHRREKGNAFGKEVPTFFLQVKGPLVRGKKRDGPLGKERSRLHREGGKGGGNISKEKKATLCFRRRKTHLLLKGKKPWVKNNDMKKG